MLMQLNQELGARCEVIRKTLMLQFRSTMHNPPPIQGVEREIFVGSLLSLMMPPNYRIGTGIVVDSYGKRSSQTDIVIEYPYGIRFPIGTGLTSLYVAESVAVAIEVKSDFTRQWKEITQKIKDIRQLRRRERVPLETNSHEEQISSGDNILLPFFVVSYLGPKKMKTLEEYMAKLNRNWPSGILIVDSGLYLGRSPWGWITTEGKATSIFGFMAHLTDWLQHDTRCAFDLTSYLDPVNMVRLPPNLL